MKPLSPGLAKGEGKPTTKQSKIEDETLKLAGGALTTNLDPSPV
jgi:hypothetical protein